MQITIRGVNEMAGSAKTSDGTALKNIPSLERKK